MKLLPILLVIYCLVTAIQAQSLYISPSIGNLKVSDYSEYNSHSLYKAIIGISFQNKLNLYTRIGYWGLNEMNDKMADDPYRIKVRYFTPGLGMKLCLLSNNNKTGLYFAGNGIYHFIIEQKEYQKRNFFYDYSGNNFGYSYEIGIFHKFLPQTEASVGFELLFQNIPLTKGTLNGSSILDSGDYSAHPISFSMKGININFAASYYIKRMGKI